VDEISLCDGECRRFNREILSEAGSSLLGAAPPRLHLFKVRLCMNKPDAGEDIVMVNKDHRRSFRNGARPDFVSRFREVANSPTPSSDEMESSQWISVVLRTDWVEILLVRTSADPHHLSVEVEISTPNTSSLDEQALATRKLPLDMIVHMEYLLKLLDEGFSLTVIGEEGLWLASKDFCGTPSSEILDILVPPTVV